MAPKLWVQLSGEVMMHLTYPQETWASLVDGIGINSHVIVEMPVRKEVPELWREIFGPVSEARRGLVRGGGTTAGNPPSGRSAWP